MCCHRGRVQASATHHVEEPVHQSKRVKAIATPSIAGPCPAQSLHELIACVAAELKPEIIIHLNGAQRYMGKDNQKGKQTHMNTQPVSLLLIMDALVSSLVAVWRRQAQPGGEKRIRRAFIACVCARVKREFLS